MARKPTGSERTASSAKTKAQNGDGSGEYIPKPEDFLPDPGFKKRASVKVPFWKANRAPLLLAALLLSYFAGSGIYEDHLERTYLTPGIAAYQNGQYPVAEHDLESYLQWWGGNPDGHYYLGMCYVHDHRRADALQQFLKDLSGVGIRNREIVYINYRSRVQIQNLR